MPPPRETRQSVYDEVLREIEAEEAPTSNRPTTSSGRTGFDVPPPYYSEARAGSRRNQLQRALRGTQELAEEASRDIRPFTRSAMSHGSGAARRRPRSASSDADEPPEFASARPESQRRSKRRRLDDSVLPSAKQPIKYGHYGQVEPGNLQMQLISCDGGEHKDLRAPDMYVGPDNVLRIDKSVYCSERQSATIILRHADDTPFTLERLHIVGPEHGFTAPVSEGLAFVAMDFSDIQRHIDRPIWARRHGMDEPPYAPSREPVRLTEQEEAEYERSQMAARMEFYASERARRRERRRQGLGEVLDRDRNTRRLAQLSAARLEARRSEAEGLTLSDALRDPEIDAALDRDPANGVQHGRGYLLDSRGVSLGAEGRLETNADFAGDYYGDDFGFGRRSPAQHCDPPELTTAPSLNTASRPSITVTSSGRAIPPAPLTSTHTSAPYLPQTAAPSDRPDPNADDSDPDHWEDSSTQEILDYRLQRLRRLRRSYTYDPENYGQPNTAWALEGLSRNPAGEEDGSSAALRRRGWEYTGVSGRVREARERMERLDSLMGRTRIRSEEVGMPEEEEEEEEEEGVEATEQYRRFDEAMGGGRPPTRFGRGQERIEYGDRGTGGRENVDDDKVTCARFRIEKGKHRAAIRFEPAISGRFVMLKLWAGQSNVDVQSVVVKGFAGPRFFESKGFM